MTFYTAALFTLENMVSLVLLAISKSGWWILYLPFYCLAAVLFCVGMAMGLTNGSGLRLKLVEELYMLFTLEAMQLLLFYGVEPRCREDGNYELFQHGFSCKELVGFLATAAVAAVVGLLLGVNGHQGALYAIAGLCFLVLLAALLDGFRTRAPASSASGRAGASSTNGQAADRPKALTKAKTKAVV